MEILKGQYKLESSMDKMVEDGVHLLMTERQNHGCSGSHNYSMEQTSSLEKKANSYIPPCYYKVNGNA